MNVTVDGYEFNFPNAIEAYKFDETDNMSPHHHGVAHFKAVDVMVELPDKYLFIEIKTYEDFRKLEEKPDRYDGYSPSVELRRNLVGKYRDTFIYRYCEDKLDKEIFYICLLNFDAALRDRFAKELRKHIPAGKGNARRWRKKFLPKENLIVVDENSWNRNLSDWGTCHLIQ